MPSGLVDSPLIALPIHGSDFTLEALGATAGHNLHVDGYLTNLEPFSVWQSPIGAGILIHQEGLALPASGAIADFLPLYGGPATIVIRITGYAANALKVASLELYGFDQLGGLLSRPLYEVMDANGLGEAVGVFACNLPLHRIQIVQRNLVAVAATVFTTVLRG